MNSKLESLYRNHCEEKFFDIGHVLVSTTALFCRLSRKANAALKVNHEGLSTKANAALKVNRKN